MEGVLVSVKKDGSTITTTVVTNDKGQYSFPADRLEPGKYTISIRAAGYVLDGPKTVEISPPAAPRPTSSSPRPAISRLSSPPASCSRARPARTGKKAYRRLRRLSHVAAHLHVRNEPRNGKRIFQRMGRYYPGSTPQRPQLLVPGGARQRSAHHHNTAKASPEFLASISLNAGPEGIRVQDRCPPERASPPRSSSPSTICRAKRRCRMTWSSMPTARPGIPISARCSSASSIRRPAR